MWANSATLHQRDEHLMGCGPCAAWRAVQMIYVAANQAPQPLGYTGGLSTTLALESPPAI